MSIGNIWKQTNIYYNFRYLANMLKIRSRGFDLTQMVEYVNQI